MKAQRFGVATGMAIDKPIVDEVGILIGKPYYGLTTEFGYFPDEEWVMGWNIRLGIYLGFNDSCLASVRSANGQSYFDVPMKFNTGLFTASLHYSLSLPQNFTDANVYPCLSLGVEFNRFKYKLKENNPNFEMDPEYSSIRQIGMAWTLEMIVYLDKDNYYLYGSAGASYRDTDYEDYDNTTKLHALIRGGIVFLLGD